MRCHRSPPRVTLFPFLSVLLSTMGVLAFLSISFLLITPDQNETTFRRQIEFQWVGAPGYVKPIFISCYEDRIEYFNLFRNSQQSVTLKSLMHQIQNRRSELIQYLAYLISLNATIRKKFGRTEYYPLILVYPKGVLASEILMEIIGQIEDLNVGLEPMLSHWEVPYQVQ